MFKGVKPAAVIALGLLTLGLLVASCGGSGGDEATAAVTKPQFIKRATAVCKKASDARDAVSEKIFATPALLQKKQDVRLRMILHPFYSMPGELRELAPPERDEKRIEAIIGALERSLAHVKKDPGSTLVNFPFETYDELAKAYGLEACVI